MTKYYPALIFGLLIGITGCTEKTSEEYIALAEAQIQQNDNATAIIELKNAIGVNPRDARARFLLGDLYAQQGSSAAAEKELTRALDLGYEPNEVLPVLANVYSLQFKHNEIIKLVEDARNLAPEVSTSLLLYKALAHFQLGQPYKAKRAIADANEINADSLYSKLGNAYVDFSNKQIDTSLEKIEQILKERPDFADAHLLKGQLTTAANNTQAAVESYEKYKALLPKTYQSRVLLANAYLKNKQYEEAEKEVDILLQVNPEQPFVNQLKGAIRFQAQDFENAKLHIEKAIHNGSANLPNKIIAGVSSFQLGSHELAYEYLNSIKGQLPAGHPIFKMLAILELKLGNSVDAGETLTSLDGLSEDDIILLSAASAQLMREGNTSQLRTILDKVDTIEFNDPLRIAQKGMLRLSLDDIDGLADLEQALSLDPDQDLVNTALARAYVNNGLYEKALELSQKWIEQKPQEVYGYVLAAISYDNMKKAALAEQMFNKALSFDPNNIAANTYYADKAEAAGDKTLAISFLAKIIGAYPEHTSSLRKHFVLQHELGNDKEAIRPIESAFNRANDKFQFRLLFSQALLTVGKYSECIGVLESVEPDAKLPDAYWVVLGNAYYYNKQREKALNVTETWLSQEPNNKSAYLRLIALQDLFKQFENALETTKSAKLKFSDDPQFTLLTIYFYIVTNDIKAAESVYSGLSDEVRNSVAGQGLRGQIMLEKGDAKSALPKLKAFYEQKTNQRNATLVAKALKELKLYSQAITFLQGHKKYQGESVTNDVQIAELAIVSGNYQLAIDQYLLVLDVEPNNTRALNNLAYILVDQGNYQRALQYAERAAALKPDYQPILDTYGTTLHKSGMFSKAAQVYAKAYSLDKANVELAIRYAEALIAAKEHDKAAQLLSSLQPKDPATQVAIQRLQSEI
ncbi:XrtA/PEP-CTERM system TPR-repeat protein PrsT [Paraglaciecola aestuariivivens]